PPPSPPLLPYTALFRSLLFQALHTLGTCVIHKARQRHLNHSRPAGIRGDDELLVFDALFEPICQNTGIHPVSVDRRQKLLGVLRSEEHTSELQSRENLV